MKKYLILIIAFTVITQYASEIQDSTRNKREYRPKAFAGFGVSLIPKVEIKNYYFTLGSLNGDNLGLYGKYYLANSIDEGKKYDEKSLAQVLLNGYILVVGKEIERTEWGIGLCFPIAKGRINVCIGPSFQKTSEHIKLYDKSKIIGDNGNFYIITSENSNVGLDLMLVMNFGERLLLMPGVTVGKYTSFNIAICGAFPR